MKRRRRKRRMRMTRRINKRIEELDDENREPHGS